MEPVVLIDKSRNKETHLVTGTNYTFEDLLHSAKRINTGLFEGSWHLSYIDSNTKKPVPIGKEEEIGTYTEQDIDTFYWNYRPVRFKFPSASDQRNHRYREQSRAEQQWKRTYKRPETNTQKPPIVAGGLQTLRYADISKRAIAYLIDAAIMALLLRVFRNSSVMIVWWLYFAGLESSGYQATIGKMIMGLRVTDMNGNKIGFVRASLRHVFKFISQIILLIGMVIAVFSEKKQALHDLGAGTMVLEEIER